MQIAVCGTGILPVPGGLEAQPLLPTIELSLCGTGILPVPGGLEAQPLLPTIELSLCGTGILPVPKNNNQKPKNHAPQTVYRENHAGEYAKPAGSLRTRRQSI
ncbi:hypothetical protein QUB70_12995 [Microcoleus sp. A003_D6]|uniref:hypothetical protein n=1 Tax=Microcoleus sp. A003_D6 TaxID=3055266 RepID=UPI002FD73A80